MAQVIAHLHPQGITFPEGGNRLDAHRQSFEIAGFPGVISAIDDYHVQIESSCNFSSTANASIPPMSKECLIQ